MGYNLNKIGSNVFNKLADKITMFNCHICNLENRSNYNLNRVFDQMTKLDLLAIGLDNEIPLIGPPNLQYLSAILLSILLVLFGKNYPSV